jgi:Protein of unknown function (DUF1553)/Protein of unknown function (DUF1549)/Concanavalin A-like lectin/glucanases superfamily/Planctomycete cytochrome C
MKQLVAVLKITTLLILAACLIKFFALQPAMAVNPQAGAALSRVDFNRDIRPILSDKCWLCHGPDAPSKRLKLRLDSEAAAQAELSLGRHAIVPGHTEQSELVRRITAENELERMPPVYSNRTLNKQEIELLTEWIRQGAVWQKHWSFIPPSRPALPAVTHKAWPLNPIDYFVLERLEKEGLQPAPEADRATLIRRVSLDLTGLPPTPAEVDSFLNDTSPNAYEKVVDRLLSSPRYGERMAFRWLDAARYADTNGYQLDGDRSMWRWRDWVIEAFNRNLPFDRFVIEQLAGDLLPNPTLDQKIATAFNRNHRNNSEDGIVPEEYAVEYVVDRVDTTSTVFMGLTIGCARCHNHKFDPITQKEYYQLYAFFNNLPEYGRVSNFGNAPPWIFAPDREEQRQLKQLDDAMARTGKQLAALVTGSIAAQRRWEKSLSATPNRQWFPPDHLLVHHALDERAELEVKESGEKSGAKASDEDDSPIDSTPTEANPSANSKGVETGFKDGAPKFVPAPTGQGVEFDGNIFFDAGKVANFDYRDRVHDFKHRFAISAWIYPESENSGAIVTRMRDNAEAKENGLPKLRGYGLFFVNGKIHFNLVGVWADDSLRVETANRLPPGQWHHFLATFDSQEPLDKARIFINGKQEKLQINQGRLFRQFADSGANLRIGGGGGADMRFKGAIDEVRIYTILPDAEQIAILACADSLDRIAGIPPGQRSEGQRLKILNAFLENGAPAPMKQLWQELRQLKDQRAKLELTLPTVMVMQELTEPRPAHLLKRGAYDAAGEKIERGVPAALPSMPPKFPNNRLGLAQWLVSRDHPLTSRVTVNRFWQMLFGTGLVKTVEDFGAQGELPSHPELLDWLAVEFMNPALGAENGSNGENHSQVKGWNTKALLKTIVMSATYRQSSRVTPQLQQLDPENRLLARGPRLRLPAEMIRDQALFVSGLLVENLGGMSVRPYQPEGLYKDMAFSNMTGYNQERGEGLWRRSLYTFWKRTIMPPAMQVFDATARESCTVREPRTNTPLQALNLMNDVTYVEAARLLGERMIKEGGATPESRIAWAFRLATARQPDDSERRVLLGNLNAQLDYFQRHPQEAAGLLSVGAKRNDGKLSAAEVAAYSITASLLLNVDEVITKQ